MLIRLVLMMLLAGSAAGTASPLPDYPFVFTSGSATREIAPDIGELTFTVSSRGLDAEKAVAAVDAASKRVESLLRAAAVKADDIDASSLDKTERRHWEPDARESVPDGYEVSRRFVVRVRDLSRYPGLLKGLFALPESERFSVSFDRTDREQIRRQLFDQAASDAKARAGRMATSFGRTLGPVRAIAQVPFASMGEWLGFPGDAGYRPPFIPPVDSDTSMDRLLVPATVRISVDVNTVFELQ